MNSAVLKTQEMGVNWKKKKSTGTYYGEVGKLKLSIFVEAHQKQNKTKKLQTLWDREKENGEQFSPDFLKFNELEISRTLTLQVPSGK